MILHLVKCEMCDKQFEYNPMERPVERLAPEGWLMLSQMKDMAAHEGWHFCCSACLRIWFANNYPILPAESPFIRREEVPA